MKINYLQPGLVLGKNMASAGKVADMAGQPAHVFRISTVGEPDICLRAKLT